MSLALVAIILSGLTLVWTAGWSVYTYRRATRPGVTVNASWGYPTYDLPGGGSRLGDRTIMLTATNSGQVPVTLSGCKLFIRGQPEEISVAPIDWVAQTPSSLPIRLDPGGHWTSMIAADPVKQSLDRHFGPREHREVRAALWDTAGRTYRPARSRKGWRRLWPSPWMKL